jgi:transcription termination/antitermination protein NusA
LPENSNVHQFIKNLAEREGVSEDRIKEIIVESFRKSYCREENSRAELSFEFNAGLSVHRLYQIVEKVNNPEKEISKNDELLKKGQKRDGKLFLPLDVKNFSASLSNEIRKQLLGDLEEISQGRRFKVLKSLQGQIVKGTVEGTQGNYYLVRLEKGIGCWEKKEWTLSEDHPLLRKKIFFLIKEVKEKVEKNLPQIILTRHDNLFIQRLLEQEIPQIKEGIIAIRHILRIPGLVSKVVVEKGKVAIEKGLNINPYGTCVGERGERAKAVSWLAHERIEIVNWSEDKKTRLDNFLSPAKVIELVETENDWNVTILQEKISLVLEHQGKVLKEISNYLGKNIHVRSLEEVKKEKNTIMVWNGKLDDKEVETLCKKINK